MFVVQGVVAGLAVCLKGQFVNNLYQRIDQGILEITMLPQWIYNIHLRWETIVSVWNGGIIAGTENDCIVSAESLSKEIISFLCSIKKICNFSNQVGQVSWTGATVLTFTVKKIEIIFQSRQVIDSVLHQHQPLLLGRGKITHVIFYIHETQL